MIPTEHPTPRRPRRPRLLLAAATALALITVAIDAGRTVTPAIMPVAATPHATELAATPATADAATRANLDAELRGLYTAPVGSARHAGFSYRADYEFQARPDAGHELDVTARATEAVRTRVHGVFHMQVARRDAGQLDLVVQATDCVFDLDAGADAVQRASAAAFVAALETFCAVRVDVAGNILGYAFQPELTAQQRNHVRGILASFFHPAPPDGEARFQSRGADATGEFIAACTMRGEGADRVVVERRKERYTTMGSELEIPHHELTGTSTASFSRSAGWLAAVQVREHLLLDVPGLPTRFSFRIAADFDSRADGGGWQAPTAAADPDRWGAWQSASGAGEDLAADAARNEHQEWARRLASVTLQALLDELRAVLSHGDQRDPAFFAAWQRLAWKFRLDAATIEATRAMLLDGVLEPEVGGALLSALGKAATPAAQGALLAVFATERAGEAWRHGAALALFQVAEPTPEVFAAITARLQSARSMDGLDAVSVLLLGALAPRRTAPLPGARSALAELLAFEARAGRLDATELWLDALGNAAVPAVGAAARRYLDHAEPAVRKAAVAALDRSGAEDVTEALVARATGDSSLEVRLRAVAALGRRGGVEGRRTLRELLLHGEQPLLRFHAAQAMAAGGALSVADRATIATAAGQERDADVLALLRQLAG